MSKKLAELQAQLTEIQNKLQDEKDAVEEKIELLKRQEFDTVTPVRHLAALLHRGTCRYNHTDGCSWYDEKDWDSYSHRRYLDQAERLLRILPLDFNDLKKVEELAKAFAGYDVKSIMDNKN
jgi:hypothetical protein